MEGQLKELNTNILKATATLTSLNEKLHNNKSRIDKTELKISKRITTILSKPHLKDIFDIKLESDITVKSIDFAIKTDKKDEIIHKYFGKKLLITDRYEWSSVEILKSYREQDCIEKIFRDTKDTDHFSIRPQYHYTDQKIRVHIFCCLLGLTFATVLQKEAFNHGISLSKDKMLDVLHNIRQCWIKEKDGNKVKKTFEEMNEMESNLWSVFSQL